MEFGGTLHDAEKVLDIQPGSIISIKTNKNSYRAKRLIITAGEMITTKLTRSLMFTVQCVCIYRCTLFSV